MIQHEVPVSLDTTAGLAGALQRFGFLPNNIPADAEALEAPGALTSAVWDYQVFHGLVADSICGPVTKAHMMQPRCCSRPDIMTMADKEFARSRRWPTDEITFGFLNLNDWPFQSGEVRDVFGWINNQISQVTRLKFKEVAAQKAMIRVGFYEIDGRGSVLGWMQLPDGSGRSREMRIDSLDSWVIAVNPSRGFTDIVRVVFHEEIHGLGVGHLQGNGTALMNPVVSGIRTLQAADIAALRQIGYPAPSSGPLPDPNPGGGGGSQQTITVEIDGTIRSASIPGHRVTPLMSG